jgi:hypothetical protein
MSRARVSILYSVVIASSVAGVAYGATHLPPPGWQTAPEAIPIKKSGPARCMGSDCMERQRLVDAATHSVISDSIDVPIESIPKAITHKAIDGQPSIEGAPPLHFIDGDGKPPPWKDGPKGEIRVLPPGDLGEIGLHDSGYSPSIEKTEFRGLGYGLVRNTDKGKVDIAGSYAFTVIGHGDGTTLSFDHVEGKLDNALKSDVRLWVHADMIPIARKTFFAFRQSGNDGEELHVVMPEVIRELESASVAVDGAFFPSRFSRTWTFSDYVFPIKADVGSTAFFQMEDNQVHRFRAAGANPDKDWSGEVIVDLNGTEGGRFVLRIRFPKG